MDDCKLIQLIQQQPCLYDAKNLKYKDMHVRDNEWMKIAEELKHPVEECKNRWKNIRDAFKRRMRNKKILADSARSQKQRKWHLEEFLEFLNHVENEKATLTQEDTGDYNCYEENSQTGNIDVEINTTIDDEIMAESLCITINENMTEQQPNKVKEIEQESNKRQQQEIACCSKKAKVYDLLEKNLQLLSKPIEQRAEDEHPIDVFFKSMAASVKKLDKERQIRAKMKVCQIIGELELDQIISTRTENTFN